MTGHFEEKQIGHFKLSWVDSGRTAKGDPDPDYPDGIDIALTRNKIQPSCRVELPYPAKRIGFHLIECEQCGYSAVVTAAGRVDDPRSVTLPCKIRKQRTQ
jgi:hypothetical protein